MPPPSHCDSPEQTQQSSPPQAPADTGICSLGSLTPCCGERPPRPLRNFRKDPVELVPNVELPGQWAVHFKCRHHPETASRRLDQPTATTVRRCPGPHPGGQWIATRIFIFPNLSCDYWRLIALLNYISLIMSQVENTFIFKNFLPVCTCSFEVFLAMILPMEIKEISLLSVTHCKCLYSFVLKIFFSSVLELLIFCVVRFISLFFLASGLSCFF